MIIIVNNLEEKLASDSYRLSKSDIIFSNEKGFSFKIPKETFFDVISRYIQSLNIYEITVRYYNFSNALTLDGDTASSRSPLAVYSRNDYRLNDKYFAELTEKLNKFSDKMNKQLFESRLLMLPEIKNYIYNLNITKEKNNGIRILAENNAMQPVMPAFQTELSDVYDKIYNTVTTWAEDIEFNKPAICQFLSVLNLIIVFISACFLIGLTVSSSDFVISDRYPKAVTLCVMTAVFGTANFILKPKKAVSLYAEVLLLPLKFLNYFGTPDATSADMLRDEDAKLKLIEAAAAETNIKAMESQIKTRFIQICSDIFNADNHVSPADFHETETRSYEELCGNYERVMFPVYSAKKKVSLVKNPSAQNKPDENNPLLYRIPPGMTKKQNQASSNNSEERKTINLTKR